MKHYLTIILLFMTYATATAADGFNSDYDTYESGPTHWVAAFTFGLNNDGYEGDLGVTWWPVRGFGFKLALGLAGEFDSLAQRLIYDEDDYYYEDYDYDYATRFKFMPSLELRTPAIIKSEDMSVNIFASPGLILSPGARGSKDAEWHNWQIRTGVEFNAYEFAIRLGYGYSDYYLYSGDPISHTEHEYHRKRNTHSGFLSFGFYF